MSWRFRQVSDDPAALGLFDPNGTVEAALPMVLFCTTAQACARAPPRRLCRAACRPAGEGLTSPHVPAPHERPANRGLARRDRAAAETQARRAWGHGGGVDGAPASEHLRRRRAPRVVISVPSRRHTETATGCKACSEGGQIQRLRSPTLVSQPANAPSPPPQHIPPLTWIT